MFKIGQRVVCKDPSETFGIIKGKIYIINDIYKCICGTVVLIIKDTGKNVPSKCDCGKLHSEDAFNACRFRPLQYDLISNEDVLKNIIKERQDIEIEKLIPEKVNE